MKALRVLVLTILWLDLFFYAAHHRQQVESNARHEREVSLRLHYLTDPWVQEHWDLYRDSFRDLPPDRVAAALAAAYVNPPHIPFNMPNLGR